MTSATENRVDAESGDLGSTAEKELLKETGDVELVAPYGLIFSAVALTWSLFQLWISSPIPYWLNFGIIGGVPARGMHLAFAFFLCFLAFGFRTRLGLRKPSWLDLALGIVGALCASYLAWGYAGISERAGELLTYDIGGMTIPVEVIIGGLGMVILLEAVRRAIGLPLVIMGVIFLAYSVFGQSMPDLISHKGVSVERLFGYQWLTGEAVFGIPISVSTRFVFLFVLFGAILDRAGAGQYFIDLAFALVGKFRGGPAKAAVLASGMTGMISGSSIANTVTTGTFTIPVMKKSGVPATKAGAFEVAASVNGQIMPPIMGAAAFVIAEFIGITYFEVVKHAAVPALISYLALFYITDLESQRLGLRPMKLADIPQAGRIFWSGAHYIAPIIVLVYLLMVSRMTAGTAVFYATTMLMGIVVLQEIVKAAKGGSGLVAGAKNGALMVLDGLITGAKNMIGVAIAVAGAGIIVGAVASTGLSNALSGVVEALAGGNVYLLLGLVAILSIILGMGLPTTANYLVVASLMVPVIIEVGGAQGLILPAIAVHLFVFYFGLMADVTPPVGLASYAAAGISRADPIRTGVQAFIYSIRTAILPFVFIFNLDLLLIDLAPGWLGWLQGIGIFLISLAAILAFTSVTFRYMFTKLNVIEMALLAFACVGLFRPDFYVSQIFPKYETVSAEAMAGGLDSADKVRLHVRRQTPYGERRRLYIADAPAGQKLSWKSLGLAVSPGEGAGTYTVSDMPAFMSPGEKLGFQSDDRIIKVDREVVDRPAKEWAFIPCLFALMLAIWWNWTRASRLPSPAARMSGDDEESAETSARI